MKEGFDIYNYDRQIKACEKTLVSSSLTKKNKELILQFKEFYLLKGYSKPRILKYFDILGNFGKTLSVDFDKATKRDIEKYVLKLQQSNLSAWTRITHHVIIKRFYKWLNGDKEYPECVEWINTTMKRVDKKMLSQQELITEDEIKKVVNACSNTRDKALISILYESGCRIGEIASLQIGNVSIDDKGAVLTVQGKTGSRKVRLIASSGLLASWYNQHPYKKDPKAPLWICIGTKNHGKIMHYQTIRMQIQKKFKQAGINKRCNPHLFRHSRATLMANHLTEFQMNHYFGWIQGSDMPSTYVHLSGKDLDGAILNMNGVEIQEEQQKSKLQPQVCSRCKEINDFNAEFCNRCATPLNKNEVINETTNIALTEQLLKKLLQDPSIQNVLKDKLIELNYT